MDGIQYPFEGDAIVHTAFVQTGDELHFFSETTKREKEMFTGGGVKETRDPVDGIRYHYIIFPLYYMKPITVDLKMILAIVVSLIICAHKDCYIDFNSVRP